MTESVLTRDFTLDEQHPVRAFGRKALQVGAGAAALGAAWAIFDPVQAARSWLVAFLFWLAVPLGSLGILSIHHVAGGRWGAVIRRPLEAAVAGLPLMALFFLPVAAATPWLFEWADPAHVAHDPILQAKAPYLNLPFFYLRSGLYFAIWCALGAGLLRASRREDADGRTTAGPDASRLEYLGRASILLYGLTMSFAAVDWVMSLEPHWFSMVFGLLLIAGQAVAAFSFTIPITMWLDRLGDLGSFLGSRQRRDLGTFLFGFVMVWAYLVLSQLLIIWSANNPEEIPWYLVRSTGGWWWLGAALFLFHFILPFIILLGRDAKNNAVLLSRLAIFLLACRFAEILWLVLPAWHPTGFTFHPLDVVMPTALGGMLLWWICRHLASRPVIAVNDFAFEEGEE